jgi:hypothetical protein
VTKGGDKWPTDGLQVIVWMKLAIKYDMTIWDFIRTSNSKCDVQTESISVKGIWIDAAWKADRVTFERKTMDISMLKFKESLLATRYSFIAGI